MTTRKAKRCIDTCAALYEQIANLSPDERMTIACMLTTLAVLDHPDPDKRAIVAKVNSLMVAKMEETRCQNKRMN